MPKMEKTGVLVSNSGAPAWVSIAVATGIGAIVTYAVSLAIDGLAHWLFNSDDTIDQSSDDEIDLDSSNGITAGGATWKASDYISFVYGGDPTSVAMQALSNIRARVAPQEYPPTSCVQNSSTQWTCGSITASKQNTGAPATCPKNSYYYSGQCMAYNYMPTTAVPPKNGISLQTAISDLPASDLEKQLNPVIVSALANAAWQKAASEPDYDGLPYPQSNPITASEAAAWMEANPEHAPTVQDFVAPNPATASNPSPWAMSSSPTAPNSQPALTPNQNTTNPAASSTQVNLGPDPGIGAPQLEAIPTAQQILDPVLNLLPSHKSFTAPSQVGQCPKPTINLYGTHVLDAHCTLIDQNKSVIETAMTFAWSVIALFIVLSA